MSTVKEPCEFVFTPQMRTKIDECIAKYPPGRQASAVIPLLDIAQRQSGGWLPRAAIDSVAAILNMPPIRVYEVASFYTMFNLKPIGRHFVQVCTTTPCWLRGSGDILHSCKKQLGIEVGQTTPDGAFTLAEVECLGACVNAPMIQINDDFYEDLDDKTATRILTELGRGELPHPGPQRTRRTTEPETGPTSLTNLTFAPSQTMVKG